VYLSGHGTLTIGADGDPQLYLVASDSRPGSLPTTAIELAELQRFFSDVRAERKALILDACWNGEGRSALLPSVQVQLDRLGDVPTLSRLVRLGESESHLFASTFGRAAREDDRLRHGVYTYHLLEALTWRQDAADGNQDGLVSIYEAHDAARAGTIAWTMGAQVPEAWFRVVGWNDLQVVGAPEQRKEAELGLIYWYGPEGDPMDGAALLLDGREKGRFPGTFAVPTGSHRVRIEDRTGRALQDRKVALGKAMALPATTLQEQPVARDGFVGLAPRARFALTDELLPLVGRAVIGVEAHGGWRAPAGPRGLVLGGFFGYAPQQARFPAGDAVRFETRHLLWFGGQLGYRAQGAVGMIGGGLRLRMTAASALTGDACKGVAACDAWLWATAGLGFEQGIALGRRWRLVFDEELGLTRVAVTGADAKSAVDLSASVGIEVAL
jgi:hypothetical protein